MDIDIINTTCKYALSNIDNQGGPFGCVIIDEDGFTIGIGTNRVTYNKDPTAHAEIMAIRDACKNRNTHILMNCKLYTSCEPCPMCLSAIYWAGIKTVYYASTRKDAEKIGFADDFIYKELSKPENKRYINMIHVKNTCCDSVFEKWKEKIDKIMY